MWQYFETIGTSLPVLGTLWRFVILALSCGCLALGFVFDKCANQDKTVWGIKVSTRFSMSAFFLFALVAFHAVLEMSCHDFENRYLWPKILAYIVIWVFLAILLAKPKDEYVRTLSYTLAAVLALSAVFMAVQAYQRTHEYEYDKMVVAETMTLSTKEVKGEKKVVVTMRGNNITFYTEKGKTLTFSLDDITFLKDEKLDRPQLEKREAWKTWHQSYNGDNTDGHRVVKEYYVVVLPDNSYIPESC